MKKFLPTLAILCLFQFNQLKAQVVNDSCHNAIEIFIDQIETFDNSLATTDTLFHAVNDCPSAGTDSIYMDIWYKYTATFTGEMYWNLCGFGTSFDSRIAVYNGNASCPLGVDDLMTCNEDGLPTECPNSESQLRFDVVEGETYLMRLGGFGTDSMIFSGTGGFNLTEAAPRPDNDDCSDAIELSLGQGQTFTNIDATTDGPVHLNDPVCFGFNDNTIQNDIWYTFTPDQNGTLLWSTCDIGGFDTRLGVYGPGASCPPQAEDLIACDDATPGCDGFTNILFFEVEANLTYLLRLGGFGGASGSGAFDLTFEEQPDPPANNLCENAEQVALISQEEADEFDIVYSGTLENAEYNTDAIPLCATSQGEFPDVYYKFSTEGEEQFEIRFFAGNDASQIWYEFFTDCEMQTVVDSACLFIDPANGILSRVDTINIIDAPDEIYMKAAVSIYSPPGPFDFQIVRLESVSNHNQQDPSLDVTLYPNPVRDQLHIDLTGIINEEVQISFYDNLGRKVLRDLSFDELKGQSNVVLGVSELSEGIYFAKVQLQDAFKVLKWTKSN